MGNSKYGNTPQSFSLQQICSTELLYLSPMKKKKRNRVYMSDEYKIPSENPFSYAHSTASTPCARGVRVARNPTVVAIAAIQFRGAPDASNCYKRALDVPHERVSKDGG